MTKRRSRPVERDKNAVMMVCPMCGRSFQFGPHIYDGRFIGEWSVTVCRGCFSVNHDGIVPSMHVDFLRELTSRGVVLKYNANGFVMWP